MKRRIDRLELVTNVAHELLHLAEEARPAECCGGLFGRRVDGRTLVTEVVETPNGARDPKRRFVIDEEGMVGLYSAGRDLDLEWLGFFHSHPEGAPRPSFRDLMGAWPGFAQLIISPVASEITGWVVSGDGAARAVAVGETPA